MKLLSQLFTKRSTVRSTRSVRLGLEELESRQLMSSVPIDNVVDSKSSNPEHANEPMRYSGFPLY